ncbi:hypothetical protein HAZT_HAZT010528 [Hyalella azteca]|uniref:Uncharacterized protein n=1 Tax=Hyalella azteca TaxID=294128 RepID=A0A6A0H4F9_HYAAZ|nr:hypothetical protein HAZT_HAZT010528 [Hyalella azteca]
MRAKQLAAAEKRAQENASRGIGNQAKVQQWQKHQENLEKQEKAAAAAAGDRDNPLKVMASELTWRPLDLEASLRKTSSVFCIWI